MRKLLAFLAPSAFVLGILGLLWLLPTAKAQNTAIGPANAILCNLATQVPIGTSGTTQVISAVASQRVYLCGWHVTNSGSTGTFQLSYGTGSNCGTGNNLLTPAFTVTSTAPATDHIDFVVMQTPAAQALCINPSVATIAAILWAAQF